MSKDLRREKIKQAVKRGVKEYHETFRLLAKDEAPKEIMTKTKERKGKIEFYQCNHDDSNPELNQAPAGTNQQLSEMPIGTEYCLKCREFYNYENN